MKMWCLIFVAMGVVILDNCRAHPAVPVSSSLTTYEEKEDMGYHWVNSSGGVQVPGAVIGGIDMLGGPTYVARIMHEGDLLPGYINNDLKVVYASYGGKEYSAGVYEVLVAEGKVRWVFASKGNVPPNAVEGGVTEDGETLYIGRVFHDSSVTLGKVHPSYRVLFIPFYTKEYSYSDYQVLTIQPLSRSNSN